MKKALIFMLAVMILTVNLGIVLANGLIEDPYSDITEDMWCYESINELYKNRILNPTEAQFYPEEIETRAGVMMYLHNYANYLGKDIKHENECVFEDVDKESDYYDAICWAYENGITDGTYKDKYEPDAGCTRQEVCTFLMRFADKYKLKLKISGTQEQFVDSLTIDEFARSAVAACKLGGVVKGDENGYFNPFDKVTKAEAAVMMCSFFNGCMGIKSAEYVYSQSGKYDYLYENYKPVPFEALVHASQAVDASWFDDAVFIGDSISVRLQYYCASGNYLGDAAFLCATSLSPENVFNPVTQNSIHPSYNGMKVSVLDGIKLSKAKKVYIMLGINSLRSGTDVTAEQLKTFIKEVKKVSPDSYIFVQSVTPMTEKSIITADNLNNHIIQQYNQNLKKICDENGWFYIDIAKAMRDENGFLKEEYCSDNTGMGIHFNKQAAQIWVDYLKTHVPKELKG